jgi:aspartyl-tRNA(Asn)/glutamyl-tRNA(Gln) amidotransferase subunit B
MYCVVGETGSWEVVIGLEVHAQITTNSKLFSRASTSYGADPNSQVSLVDAAMPGMLPTLNEQAISQAVRTGLGLGATVNLFSMFDRKNYFYPDLPQGYQISQFYHPIVSGGNMSIELGNGAKKDVTIARLHIEQDAGKSIHDYHPSYSLIDLNRSGVALMEIVSNPDLRSPEEAGLYMKKLRTILRYLGTCDGDMEKGSLRCDANVSVRRQGDSTLGTRCEIKNLNSIKNVVKAIDYEAKRQVALLENGEKVKQETRLFDADLCETRKMRSKEEAHDYRYFPDPDLLPLILSEEYVEEIRKTLPELPDQKKIRYMEELGLSSYDADVLLAERETTVYFEEVLSIIDDPKIISNWIAVELFSRLNKLDLTIEDSPVKAANLSSLLKLIKNGTISGKIAKQVFDSMFDTGKDASAIVREMNLEQVVDPQIISEAIDKVLSENRSKLAEYRAGKLKLYGFFVGEIMKVSQGKFSPEVVNNILRNKLDH